ncbi:MAG: peptide ABC transporter substrate-binding protein [Chloroflexi bacterium SZAS-1]|nr:peptide ABC transporter substrate-binding protein [Chloroflexi bacterium SZAS-1]
MKHGNYRGYWVITLLLALLVPILAACGGQTAAPAGTAEQATTAPNTAAPTTNAPEATAAAPTTPAAAAPTAAPAAASGNTLRVNLVTWPDTLDPQDASIANEIGVLTLAYEGLTRLDKDLKTVPAAAEKWAYNADATEVTFTLRDGLKYSDGSPLTAQDFVNAVRRSLDPRGVVGDYQSTLFMIKGADAILNTVVPTDEAKIPELFDKLGVTAPDAKTIKFELTQPTPYFHTLASLWVIYPAKQDLIDKGGETWYEDPANQVGNGPFKLTAIDHAQNLIELQANDNYWAGRPKLDGVKLMFIGDLAVALQAYKNNEIDIIGPDPNDVPTIKADPTLSKEYIEPLGSCTQSFELNNTKAPFDNKLVRQAFNVGLDRASFIRDALKGTSAETVTWIPPGYPGYDAEDKRLDFDAAKAKELLAQAGFANGAGLPEIKISYNSNNPATQGRVEYLIQMYEQTLGITLVPDPIEGQTLNNMRKDVKTAPQFVYGGGWCADYPDPQNWLSVFWQSSSPFAKNIGYKNADVDKLIAQADVEVDPTKRMQLYHDAQRLVIGDAPYIIRSTSKASFLVKPYIQGIESTPQDSNTYPGMTTGLLNATMAK